MLINFLFLTILVCPSVAKTNKTCEEKKICQPGLFLPLWYPQVLITF